MYAQSHAVPWTQDYDQHCYVERYKSKEFIEIYRVWHERVKILTWNYNNQKNLNKKFKIFRFFKNLKNLSF